MFGYRMYYKNGTTISINCKPFIETRVNPSSEHMQQLVKIDQNSLSFTNMRFLFTEFHTSC